MFLCNDRKIFFLFQYGVTDNKVTKKLLDKVKPEKLGPTHHKSIRKELDLSDWPPVGQITYCDERGVIVERTGPVSLTSSSIN